MTGFFYINDFRVSARYYERERRVNNFCAIFFFILIYFRGKNMSFDVIDADEWDIPSV